MTSLLNGEYIVGPCVRGFKEVVLEVFLVTEEWL